MLFLLDSTVVFFCEKNFLTIYLTLTKFYETNLGESKALKGINSEK